MVKLLGPVNVVLQRTARTKRFISHVDKLKRCLSATPVSWLSEEERGGSEPLMVPNEDQSGLAMFGDGGPTDAPAPRYGRARAGPCHDKHNSDGPAGDQLDTLEETGRLSRTVRKPVRFLV